LGRSLLFAFGSGAAVLVGLLFCAAFVVFSFFAKEQPANKYVLKKADKLVRTVGTPTPAN
jgi:hypothetical protein